MMRDAVRSHPLLRAMPKSALVAASTASVGLNLVAFERATRGAVLGLEFGDLLQFVLLLGALSLLVLNDTGRRGGDWALGLPVTARELWTDHARALLLAAVLMLLTMAAVVAGFTVLISRLSRSGLVETGTVLLHFVRPGAVLVSLSLFLAAWRSPLADPAAAPGWHRLRILLAAGSLAVLAILAVLPMAWAAAPVLVTGAMAWRARAALPDVLTKAETRSDGSVAGPVGVHRRSGGAVHHMVLRQLFKWPATWILGLPMILLLGLVVGGVANRAEDADFAQFFNIWITIYLLVAFIMHFLENVGRVDHLPVSRGLLLRWLLLPGMVTVTVGGLVGAAVDQLDREPVESMVYDDADVGLRVPTDTWEVVWGDPPAAVTAPWGETVAPTSLEIVRGLPLGLWKPFTTDAGSSPDFVAWQIARAVSRTHGIEVEPDVIRDRYLTVDPDGRVATGEQGLTLVADGLVPTRGQIGPVVALLLGSVIVGSLLTAWSIFRYLGPGATRRRVRTVFWIHMGLLMVLHLGGYGLLMTRTVTEWAVGGLVRGWAAELAGLGILGWVLPWLAIPLLAWPAWRLCARAFARVEAIRPGPGTCIW
ncbi:MAG: hypothetical protein GY838_18550 [bacterium]|nr:hypothetical protein [bacterium]